MRLSQLYFVKIELLLTQAKPSLGHCGQLFTAEGFNPCGVMDTNWYSDPLLMSITLFHDNFSPVFKKETKLQVSLVVLYISLVQKKIRCIQSDEDKKAQSNEFRVNFLSFRYKLQFTYPFSLKLDTILFRHKTKDL